MNRPIGIKLTMLREPQLIETKSISRIALRSDIQLQALWLQTTLIPPTPFSLARCIDRTHR